MMGGKQIYFSKIIEIEIEQHNSFSLSFFFLKHQINFIGMSNIRGRRNNRNKLK